MSEFDAPDFVEQARALVQERVFDDLSDALPDEDLRDYGLDSIRLIAVLGALRERGASVDFAEIVGAPTLMLLAIAIAEAAPRNGGRA